MEETPNILAKSDKPKSKKWLVILIIVVILILLITTGVILFVNSRSKEEKTIDNTSEDNAEVIYENGNEILKQACKIALSSYPNWANQTEIVLMENNESTSPRFFYRESPEDSSVSISSPASEGEELADIGLVDLDSLAYTKFKTGSDRGMEIGLLKFSGSTGITPAYTNDAIYEVYDASYFSSERVFLLYSTNDSNLIISVIAPENSEEKIIVELEVNNDANDYYAKTAVSPNSNYAYAIHSFDGEYQNSLLVFDLSQREIIKNIDEVADPVWIGGSHILFSSLVDSGKTVLFSIEDDKLYQVTAIDSAARNFGFNPNNEGIIGYDLNGNTYIINCQTFQNIASYEKSTFETFTNDKTAIITADSDAMSGTGFWRFESNWTVLLSKDVSFHSSRPMLATSFSRY